jgi:16S rRNA processing protein RimM
VRLGRVVRPHGLKGELVVRESGLEAAELAAVRELCLARADGRVVARAGVAACRAFGPDLLMSLTGVGSVERAAELRGLWLEAEPEALPPAGPGRVYRFQLLGLEVVEESGRVLGRVRRVLATGAHEVLEVAGPGGELLIPYHAGTVLGWDPAAGSLTVRLPAGLEEVYRRPAAGGG